MFFRISILLSDKHEQYSQHKFLSIIGHYWKDWKYPRCSQIDFKHAKCEYEFHISLGEKRDRKYFDSFPLVS